MTTSPYFKNTSSKKEQALIQALTRETIYLKGLDFSYIPRDSSDADWLYGEDTKSTFTTAVTVEMYPEEQQGFGGEGDFMSNFGLDLRDDTTFLVDKGRFTETVTKKYPLILRPQEGDIILYPVPRIIFEITFVDHEKPFYQRGIQTVWQITAKRFQYNADEMNTGISDVDDLEIKQPPSDSDDIQTESDTIIVFDETDPFSNNNY